MTLPNTNTLYGFPQPVSKFTPPVLIIADRAPQTTDYKYELGTLWVDQLGDDYYGLVDVTANSATWNVLASSPGNVDTLTGDSGGAIVPVAGNIDLLGTADQITTAGSSGTITFSLPAIMIAPGSLEVTGLLTGDASATINTAGTALNLATDNNTAAVNIGTVGARTITMGNVTGATGVTINSGTGGVALASTGAGDITVASGDTVLIDGAGVVEINSSAGVISVGNDAVNQNINVGTAGTRTIAIGSSSATETILGTCNINATGAGVTTIGTGGTGAVNIGNATGNTAVTGSLGTTTTLTAGTGLTVTTGGITVNGGDIINAHSNAGTDVTIEVTNSDNTNGASRSGVEIATGGASGGDPYLSFQISGVGASTMTIGLDNSASDLFVISNSASIGTSNALTLSQAGALTASTSITATLGNITATNGNLVLGSTGNKINISAAAAATDSVGTATLNGAGTVTVSTTAVTSSSLIFVTINTPTNPGILSVPSGSIVNGTSFVINSSSGTDASTVNYWIIN